MFVLFEDRFVAEEAAKAIEGYHMFKRQLRCVILPENHKIIQHKFRKNPKSFKFIPWVEIYRQKFNKGENEEKKLSKMKKLLELDEKKEKKLKELGVDFAFPGFKECL